MKLKHPKCPILVAVLFSDDGTMIDFAWLWEVFQDVFTPDPYPDFTFFTVVEMHEPINASAVLKIVPKYTFDSAPKPHIVMMGAQKGRSEATFEWLKKVDVFQLWVFAEPSIQATLN